VPRGPSMTWSELGTDSGNRRYGRRGAIALRSLAVNDVPGDDGDQIAAAGVLSGWPDQQRPHEAVNVLIKKFSELDMDSDTFATSGYACCCTAESPGKITPTPLRGRVHT
jgi:hypothetical protein